MSLFRDDGIVLRTREPGGADRTVPRSSGDRSPYRRPDTRGGER
ncbi:hypothetical protein ACFVYF_04345 [Streptomyces sp. NPDC058274]